MSLRCLLGQPCNGSRAPVCPEQVVSVGMEVVLTLATGPRVREVYLVTAYVHLGQRLREPGHGVKGLVNVPGLMQDPAQVEGLRLFGSAGILNLADMGQVRVQDVLTSSGGLDLVPLIGQDAVIDVVSLGLVELVPRVSPCLDREQGGDSQKLQDLVGYVCLRVGPEVGIGRVLPENVRDPPLGRFFELLEGDTGAYPVPVRGGLRPAPQGPRGRVTGSQARLNPLLASISDRQASYLPDALTIATIPARTVSGSRSQASMTAANSGSARRFSEGKWWATIATGCPKSLAGVSLEISGSGLIIRRSGVRVPTPVFPEQVRTCPSSPDAIRHLRQTHQGSPSRPNPTVPGPSRPLRATRGATRPCQADVNISPDLAEIVAAWPELPEAIRVGILAMVKAAARS